MRTLYVLILCGTIQLLAEGIWAQVISVVDQNTLQPVSNALVQNQDQSLLTSTDFKGEFNIDKNQQHGQIIIRHPSYDVYFITLKSLANANYTIRLRPRIISIDEIVVSANRWEQEKNQTPNRILSIAPEKVELRNPQTTADMLGSTGQVFIQKSQLGGGSPMIRGFAANSVLIVVDGVRMNNAIFRSGNLHNVISIDPFSLENTEVLFGPGSVMYGSDALGGVMHFRTKSPGFIDQDKPKVNANSLLRYSTADNEKTGHLDFTLRGKKMSLFSSVTFSDFHHLETGNRRTNKFPDYGKRFQYVQRVENRDSVFNNPDYNQQIFSGYNQFNLLNKLRVRLGDQTQLTYTLNYGISSDIPRYDRLIETDEQGEFKAAEWYYGPQKWLSNAVQLNLFDKSTLFDGAKFIVAFQNVEESRNDRGFGDAWLRQRGEKVKVITANIDMEKVLNPEHTLFYGIELFYNDVNSKAQSKNIDTRISKPIKPRYPEGGSSYTGLAGYFSYKWRPHQRMALTSGLRYNQTWLQALYRDPLNGNSLYQKFASNNGAVNGSVGMAWLPAANWQINGLISTGFRAPNVDDIGKFFDGTNGVVTVPNTKLKPEYTYNAEIGFTRSIQDKFLISATGFFTMLDNALVQENYSYLGLDSIYFDGEYSQAQALTNSDHANIYGGNFQLEYALTSELKLNSSFTITRGEDSNGQPLRHTTPNFGYLSMVYQKNQFTGEISYKFSGKRSYQDLPLSEQQKSHLYTSDGSLGWQSLNFAGSYHFSKSITLNLGVENILDHHYRPYSSGISAPGRNIIIAIKGSI